MKAEVIPPVVADKSVHIITLATEFDSLLNMLPVEPPLKKSQLTMSMMVPNTMKGNELVSKLVSF